MWLENTMDPSHANWLHDGDVGKWEDSLPLNMRLVDNAIDANKVTTALHIPCAFTSRHDLKQITKRESIQDRSCTCLAHLELGSVKTFIIS